MTSEQQPGQRVVLRRYANGPLQAADFGVEPDEAPALRDGEFRVRNLFVSVDPMLRIFIDKAPFGGAMPGMPLGTVIAGAAVGEVIEIAKSGL